MDSTELKGFFGVGNTPYLPFLFLLFRERDERRVWTKSSKGPRSRNTYNSLRSSVAITESTNLKFQQGKHTVGNRGVTRYGKLRALRQERNSGIHFFEFGKRISRKILNRTVEPLHWAKCIIKFIAFRKKKVTAVHFRLEVFNFSYTFLSIE